MWLMPVFTLYLYGVSAGLCMGAWGLWMLGGVYGERRIEGCAYSMIRIVT